MLAVPLPQDTLLTAVAAALPDPMFVFDDRGTYVDVVGGNVRALYDSAGYLIGRRLHDVLPAAAADRFLAVIRETLESGELRTVEYELGAEDCAANPQDGPRGRQWFQGRITPLDLGAAHPTVLWVAVNITARKQAEAAKEQLIGELETALAEIRTLRGIIPICSVCKKIRSEAGDWQQLERYIQAHSDAAFSHGLCPDCCQEHYGEYMR